MYFHEQRTLNKELVYKKGKDFSMTVPSHDYMVETATSIETEATARPPGQRKGITVALVFLCSCIALIMTGFGIIIPVFPQRLQSLGLGASMLALMEGGFGLGMFLFSTPMGTLADRIGRKPVVLLSLAGFILTNLALALVNIPPFFVVLRFIEGVLISGLFPAATAMIGDSVPLEKQGRWMGSITTAQAIGIAVGPAIGGFLYQAWGFTSPFLLSAGIALLATLLALFVLPETLSVQVRERARVERLEKKRQGMRTNERIWCLLWLFAPLIVIDFGIAFIYPFVIPQYPFFFEKVLRYDPVQYGVVISVYGLALAVFPILLGGLSERWPKKRIIVLGTLLYPMLNIALLVLQQYPLLVAASIITGIGDALLLPALATIYLSQTSEQNRSQVMGIRGSAISLGILLGPLIQALIGNWISAQTAFAISVGLSLVLTLITIFTFKSAQAHNYLRAS